MHSLTNLHFFKIPLFNNSTNVHCLKYIIRCLELHAQYQGAEDYCGNHVELYKAASHVATETNVSEIINQLWDLLVFFFFQVLFELCNIWQYCLCYSFCNSHLPCFLVKYTSFFSSIIGGSLPMIQASTIFSYFTTHISQVIPSLPHYAVSYLKAETSLDLLYP